MSPAAALAYNNLKGLLRQVSALAEVEGILGYDEQCFMPPGAGAARAAQKAALAKVRHSLATGDSMRAAIDGVRGRVDELPDDERLRANVRDAIKDFDQGARKSPELAEAEARLESEAFGAWQAARAASDFALFSPKLKEMFELKKEVTSELFFLAGTHPPAPFQMGRDPSTPFPGNGCTAHLPSRCREAAHPVSLRLPPAAPRVPPIAFVRRWPA